MRKHFFIFLFFLCASLSVKASHLGYAELTYKSIAGGAYELTLTLYSDCDLGFTPSIARVEYCSKSKGKAGVLTLMEKVVGGVSIFPTCAHPTSKCVGGDSLGYQKSIYTGTFTPPSVSNDWIIAFKHCCRPFTITTLDMPASSDVAIATIIDNFNYPGNNSPEFIDEPVVFACCNQLVHYDQSATDLDGDSLSYSLYTPLVLIPTCDTFTTVVYKSPYTATDPITSSPSISIDAKTGILTMKPTQCSERGLIGVRVDEYRKSVLIGSVMRESLIDFTPYVLSVNQIMKEKEKVQISPNPFYNKLHLSGIAKESKIEIYSVTGVLVHEQICNASEIDLDLSKLANGVYFVQIQTESNSIKTKIVKL